MTDETRQWFIDKVAQEPSYIQSVYLPELEKAITKEEIALRESLRNTSKFEQVKYQTGRVDGAQKLLSVIDGLRISERKPADPGLMDRIFSKFRPQLDPG